MRYNPAHTMIGTTLSRFKITGKLGEGGMGEVYRALDTELEDAVIVFIVCDRGDRYLSTGVFPAS